jgi:hypothetical protein
LGEPKEIVHKKRVRVNRALFVRKRIFEEEGVFFRYEGSLSQPSTRRRH